MSRRSELVAIASMLLLMIAAAMPRFAPDVPHAVRDGVLVVAGVASVWSLLMWRKEQAADASTRAISALYLRESVPAIVGYVIAVMVSIALLKELDATPLRAAVALLPIVPIAFMLRATARYIRGLDELQRRIELEAVALGSVAVALAYLTGGLLQGAKVIQVSGATAMLWVLPALSLAYGMAKRVVARHYG